MRHLWRRGACPAWMAALVALLAGLPAARAQPPNVPTDPAVNDLRRALIVLDPSTLTQAELDQRRDQLGRLVRQLRTPAQMIAGLNASWQDGVDAPELLTPSEQSALTKQKMRQELTDDDRKALAEVETRKKLATVDRTARALLETRLRNTFHDILRRGDEAQILAVLRLLAEEGRIRPTVNSTAQPISQDVTAFLANNQPPEVRALAARAILKQTGPQTAARLIQPLLTADDPELRLQVVTAIADTVLAVVAPKQTTTPVSGLGPLASAFAQPLADRITDSDLRVRRLASDTLRGLSEPLLHLAISVPIDETEKAPKPGEVAARSRDYATVVDALVAVIPKVARGLHDADEFVRLRSALVLLHVSSTRLRQPPPTRRTAPADRAGQALLAALPDITATASDPDDEVRQTLFEALEGMAEDTPAVVPLLVRGVTDPNLFVRWIAARSLGRRAPEQASVVVPALAGALDDPDLDARKAKLASLERYGTAARPAFAAVAANVLRGDVEVRLAALAVIDAMRPAPAEAVPILVQALRFGIDEPDIDRQADDARVRRTAADSLRKLGPGAKAATPTLRQALNDPDPIVRRSAAAILSSFDDGR